MNKIRITEKQFLMVGFRFLFTHLLLQTVLLPLWLGGVHYVPPTWDEILSAVEEEESRRKTSPASGYNT